MSYPISLQRERPPKLPLHANAVEEKLYLMRKNSPQSSRLFLPVPLGPSTWRESAKRRMIASLFFFLTWFVLGWMGYAVTPGAILFWFSGKSTLIFSQADLETIWRWEIASGHYPSNRPLPAFLEFDAPLQNPGLPVSGEGSETAPTTGIGPARTYISSQIPLSNAQYPPRPLSGGIADLDIIIDRCDFSTQKVRLMNLTEFVADRQVKYVRDCLEFMRIGAGLDLRRQSKSMHHSPHEFIYLENKDHKSLPHATDYDPALARERKTGLAGIYTHRHLESLPPLPLPLPRKPKSLDNACDPDHPRIFHMYWAGEFTDKPYMALLSYLFTQNLGLGQKVGAPLPTDLCRPQFWLWINPGPAAAVPNPSAPKDLLDSLRDSPWASPFLHPRFAEVIKFKLWNTTEQLDSIPELKDEWRADGDNLFNSGGVVYKVKSQATQAGQGDDGIVKRVGSDSEQNYDRLSTILSDMARFILCHRFGGTYLDADTILLRDWEELWGYKGAFAYRWSRLETYNTAVLRLNKGSALGTFLFRTALRNGLDFHPMQIWKYVQQAKLEGLLLRLPDALFDSAWLNTEDYQRDRPAFPYFTRFEQFFEPSKVESGAPNVVGFDGFFRGAYSYHFHNFWWLSFDPARNYPDLGSRFAHGEALAKENLSDKAMKNGTGTEEPEDLSWAAVLKRTFEAFVRGERPNMYGEWIEW